MRGHADARLLPPTSRFLVAAMSRPHFSLGTLLVIVLFAGVAFAALKSPSDTWASALFTTAVAVLLVGVVATNVIGRRLLQRVEHWLMLVPVFRTVYAPVKQLVLAFSPDNEYGFKQVVFIADARGGYTMGFLTREFTLHTDAGAQSLVSVYVPTNHLYLGDVHVVARERVIYPDLSVEEGVRIFLTGGMAYPGRLEGKGQNSGSDAVNRHRSP